MVSQGMSVGPHVGSKVTRDGFPVCFVGEAVGEAIDKSVCVCVCVCVYAGCSC